MLGAAGSPRGSGPAVGVLGAGFWLEPNTSSFPAKITSQRHGRCDKAVLSLMTACKGKRGTVTWLPTHGPARRDGAAGRGQRARWGLRTRILVHKMAVPVLPCRGSRGF